MLALLLAVALAGLIVLALLLAGAVVAAVTGVLAFNASLVVLTLRRRASSDARETRVEQERWQPSSFRRAPEPSPEPTSESASESTGEPGEARESPPVLRVHRL